MKTLRLLPLLLITSLPVPAAHAQVNENSQTMERMDRLERDLMILQRQVARGEPVTAPAAGGDPNVPAGGSADLEVRLSGIEEQMRQLRGKVEENDFQVRKLSENLDKMQKDTEFRFNELSGVHPPAAAAAASPDGAAPADAASEPGKPAVDGEKKSAAATATESAKPAATDAPEGPTTAGDGVLHLPQENANTNFATPREHYNYAFRLLNQAQYDNAAAAFDTFTKKYPKDPLVGNAYYWQGETYYIRRDYVKAADNFRQGFEAAPEGPKAADNLLKLAMSLNALNRDKEACVVLGQITTKFKKSSTSVADKAAQEQKRIGCK